MVLENERDKGLMKRESSKSGSFKIEQFKKDFGEPEMSQISHLI